MGCIGGYSVWAPNLLSVSGRCTGDEEDGTATPCKARKASRRGERSALFLNEEAQVKGAGVAVAELREG